MPGELGRYDLLLKHYDNHMMLSDTTEIWTYLLDGLILVPGRDKKS